MDATRRSFLSLLGVAPAAAVVARIVPAEAPSFTPTPGVAYTIELPAPDNRRFRFEVTRSEPVVIGQHTLHCGDALTIGADGTTTLERA